MLPISPSKIIYLLLLILMLGGCAAASTQPAPPNQSIWGDVIEVAQAEQVAPPALLATAEQVTLSWIGADASGVHQDLRAIGSGRLSGTIVLPLPPIIPHNSRLYHSGDNGGTHLLWQDVDRNGQLQLYNAQIDAAFNVFRGPLAISDGGVACYSALSSPDGMLWVLWNDGSPSVPRMYSAQIEQTGLVLQRQPIRQTHGCPVMTETLTGRYVIWRADDALWSAELLNGRLRGAQLVSDLPPLTSDQLIEQMTAGSDGVTLSVFWNVIDAQGSRTTWVASGLPDTPAWGAPRELTFAVDNTNTIQTTLNTGQTQAATWGTDLRGVLAAPMRGVTTILPVAVFIPEADPSLGIVYLRAGDVIGYQRVVAVDALLRPPVLQIDRDRHLYLTWSEPTEIGAARLLLISTKTLIP